MGSVDVLIVGGGPTGSMLALELATHNVSFRIIDKLVSRSDKSRALIVQPRTLELFNRHGIARELISRGKAGRGAKIFINKKLAGQIDFDDLGFQGTEFPLPLWISQAETEHFLDEGLEGYGRQIERGVTAEKIEQDDSGVSVMLRGPDGKEEQIRCKYVVGCDGAHSVVRHSANLTFEGSAYPQSFELADVKLKWDYPGDHLIIGMGRGAFMIFPLKDGLYRVVLMRNAGPKDANPTLAEFQQEFLKFVPVEAELYDPVWISSFHLHHRGVNTYRSKRLFVAGDAAHIHSPAGGQGMNTGIQDAVNLGWKLALVLQGEKDDAFLDSYNAERHPVGQHLLTGTDRMFTFATTSNPFVLFLRNTLLPWVLPWVFNDRNRRAGMFRFLSELGVRYRRSPIVGTATSYNGPVRGGDRAPDGKIEGSQGKQSLLDLCSARSHHLILFSGTESEAANAEELQSVSEKFLESYGKLASVHRIYSTASVGQSKYHDVEGHLHTIYGFSKPGYVLIRPDGYVAHIGPITAMDEFLAWLKS